MTINGSGEDARPWGLQLKEWREAKRWTRADLREQIEAASYQLKEARGDLLDTRLIAKWERGEVRRPQNVYLRLLAHLGSPIPQQVCSQETVPDTQVSRTTPIETEALWLPSLDTSAIVTEFTRRDLSLNRRELHRLLGTVFVGGPLLDHLERWLTAPTHTSGTHNPVVPIGSPELAELDSAARMFRDWDEKFGGGLRRKAVIGQLNEVSEMIPDTRVGSVRNTLYQIMAQLSETAAMMSWDSGLQSAAQRYYVLSIRSARAGGDTYFAAHAMAGMARQLLYLGYASDALEVIRLAQTSIAHLDSPPRLASMLAAREAWCYAHLGRIAAFERATGQAEELLPRTRTDESEPYWIQYFDDAELQGTTGGRLLEIAQTGHATYAADAIDRINRALDNRDDGRLRSSALDLIGLSQAYMLNGELDEGARLGHHAITAVGSTSSDRVRVMLGDFHRDMTKHTNAVSVRELRTRVSVALAGEGSV